MAVFFTSDWHLGEDRFQIMQRPFSSQEEMVKTLIDNHNALVSPSDTVYMVGDVVYQKTPEFLKCVKEFNGKKILIRGNHDRGLTDDDFAPYFEEIIPEGDGIELDVEGISCYVTHYPTRGQEFRFNLVGHIHHSWKVQLNMFNVGVDVNHFRPVPAETIPFMYNAICNFFDEDCWVAYNPINAQHQEKRGKKSVYFSPEKEESKS